MSLRCRRKPWHCVADGSSFPVPTCSSSRTSVLAAKPGPVPIGQSHVTLSITLSTPTGELANREYHLGSRRGHPVPWHARSCGSTARRVAIPQVALTCPPPWKPNYKPGCASVALADTCPSHGNSVHAVSNISPAYDSDKLVAPQMDGLEVVDHSNNSLTQVVDGFRRVVNTPQWLVWAKRISSDYGGQPSYWPRYLP
ncbi:hypothetical protein VUR80DRAFT_281 [Thermomyces stellatus]